jgi:Transmembrane family 220, helix
MNKIHKYLALFLVLIFAIFAAVQYNDPDPWLWIPIYGMAAAISWGVFQGKLPHKVFFPACIAFLAGAVWFFPPQWEGLHLESMRMKNTNQELGRESMGLAVCALVMLYYHFITKKR